MPEYFQDRLREAVVDLQAIDVDQLRTRVRPTGAKVKYPRILDLVRLAHGREVSDGADAAFRRSINGKQQFLRKVGDKQLRNILALSCLIEAFSSAAGSPAVTTAALAVRTVELSGWTPVHADLRAYADRWLSIEAEHVRRPHKVAVEPGLEMLHKVKLAETDPESLTNAVAAVSNEFGITHRNFSSLKSGIVQLAAVADFDRRVNREQQQLLWWLLSATTPQPSALLATQVAAGLAASTGFVPGPLPADQLLRRKLGNKYDEEIALEKLSGLTRADPSLARDASAPVTAEDLVPLLTVLVGESSPARATAVTVGVAARALYDELLFVRSVRNMEDAT